MPQMDVESTEPDGPVARGLLADFDRLMQSVRKRAYELFEGRGHQDGADVDDWYRAEAELLSPVRIETAQEPSKYTLRVSVPRFSAKDLKVYTVGENIVLKGTSSGKSEADGASSEQNKNLFCQWPLPAGAHVDEIKADYEKERLTITIPTEARSKSVRLETPESKLKASSATVAAA